MKISRKQRRYFQIAEKNSYLSAYTKIKIGVCIVTTNGKIITGYNTPKSHTFQFNINKLKKNIYPWKKTTSFLHAEIVAYLSDKSTNYQDADIYLFRKQLDGSLGMCRPCISCMSVLISIGVKNIYYTSPDGIVHERVN
jgi:deoxycytidylate deaminase